MDSFAIVNKDNVVENIELGTEEYLLNFYKDKKIIKTTDYEKNISIGYEYDDGYFYDKKPYSSWIKKEGDWVAPKERPSDFVDIQWRGDTEDDIFLSKEELQSLSFNSAGRPKEFIWEWNEEIGEWEKFFIREQIPKLSEIVQNDIDLWRQIGAKWAVPSGENEEFAGRFTSETYAE
jgi:hypothetical protein